MAEAPREGLAFVKAHADLMQDLAKSDRYARLSMSVFMTRGRVWSEYVIDRLAIPARKAKAVEMAARTFARTRPPKDITKWVSANERRFDLLLEAVHWPPREEGGDDIERVFQRGPFKVHNTVHASGKGLDNVLKTLDLAIRAAGKVDLPGFPPMLRGDLFLVGQIARKGWAAWYMPSKDAIYLRPKIRGISPEESARHLVHELGHRYWHHVLPRSVKVEWMRHHDNLSYGGKAELPEVGEVLPMKVNRKTVVVDRYDAGKAFLMEHGSGKPVGSVLSYKLFQWMQNAAVKSQYPTSYASTDAEEHFCEALSLKAFGTLEPSHRDAFDHIFQGSSVNKRVAKAQVTPVRQRSQYSCMAASLMMCLQANGLDCTEDEVNAVLGARPMKGAAWEHALACAQHYGMRATLTSPCTVRQLKDWTDRGVPVMIAWNPEGRDWSHASVVFDVVEDQEHGFLIHVADPNIPDPDETVRVVPKKEFYGKWAEKWPNYLVRRSAMAIEREITPDGRQVMASTLEGDSMGHHPKSAARPGPHQNPWPQKRFDTKNLLNVLDDYAKEDMFYVLFDDASEQQFIMVQQLRDAVKRGDRTRAKRLAEHLKKGRSSISQEIAHFNPLWTWILDGSDFLNGRKAFESLSIPQWKRALSEHVAKFPQGEKMTVDEVAEVVGPEFKQMNENPPEAVQKTREKMQDSKKEAATPRRARLSWQRRAEETAADVNRLRGYVQRTAREAALNAFQKDARVLDFLRKHADKDVAARVLHDALREVAASDEGAHVVGGKPKLAFENVGLYGLPHTAVKLGMSLCADLTNTASSAAWTHHSRKPHRHDLITAALEKDDRPASTLLASIYPEADQIADVVEIPSKLATRAIGRREAVKQDPVVANTVEAWLEWDPTGE